MVKGWLFEPNLRLRTGNWVLHFGLRLIPLMVKMVIACLHHAGCSYGHDRLEWPAA
jgi:hypothetical protein